MSENEMWQRAANIVDTFDRLRAELRDWQQRLPENFAADSDAAGLLVAVLKRLEEGVGDFHVVWNPRVLLSRNITEWNITTSREISRHTMLLKHDDEGPVN
jgi:hypothetical protein